VLADPETHADPQVRASLGLALARAAGPAGMVGGQMIDLEAQHSPLDIAAITRLQRMKTGAIIAFACESGALLAKASDAARHALHNYAHDLGLAFQIADDLLDVEGSESATGKPVGQDQVAGKATFVAVLGVDEARRRARFIADQAASHLDFFENRADLLKAMARFVVTRQS
jgi:farnesyl diphosphate synthase